MRHLIFLAILIICSVVEAKTTLARPRIRWTWDVSLAYISWYSLVIVSMIWPDWAHARPIYGAMAFIGGSALVIAARRANPYFTPNLQVSPVIVKTGIYRHIKHPAYLGMALSASGIWVYFYSWQATIPFIAYLAILFTRVRREEALING